MFRKVSFWRNGKRKGNLVKSRTDCGQHESDPRSRAIDPRKHANPFAMEAPVSSTEFDEQRKGERGIRGRKEFLSGFLVNSLPTSAER
ncbi:hypothetical protein TNIN_72361 [Trichonephila inaurata madagascariensis]|uniref:Uncharacterized protein n=1 Tax=Trichonephila inaurata madagascariensis TaxID=2747483 RepID=A0A8X6WRT6_9ARAC|nr:hypothetical protein TNIN_72361 [Trichonephila inaurata madagascariensis]